MKIALITGASSGMGREFVYAIDRDFELDEIWVVARRKERLEELAGKCRAKIRPVALDLGKRENFAVLKEMFEAETPDIRVLVNAAGFGLFGVFYAAPAADIFSTLLAILLLYRAIKKDLVSAKPHSPAKAKNTF